MLCEGRPGHRRRRGPAEPDSLHPLGGQQSGYLVSAAASKVLSLPFKQDIRRPDRDNTIDVYISDDYMDVLADGIWEQFFTVKPEPLSREEKKEWLKT